jgi:hypothetical protein
MRVIACLAAGRGIRGRARGCEVDPQTGLSGLGEAAEQGGAFSASCLRALTLGQVQLAELDAVLRAVPGGDVRAAAALEQLSRPPPWVWTAIDPERKLWLALDGDERTLALAQRVVHHVVPGLAPDCAPLCVTDGFRDDLTALLTPYGPWVPPSRHQATGPAPKPRWMPRPQLLSAQVIKTRRRRRLVKVTPRVVFGTPVAVGQVLVAWGWPINTAFVERLHLSLRQHVAAMGRRTSPLGKGKEGWRQPLTLCHVYQNFVLPHARLRQPLLVPKPTNGPGAAQGWRPCTPAMAAGLTDQVWTLKEGLMVRVPPWLHPLTVSRVGEVDGRDAR